MREMKCFGDSSHKSLMGCAVEEQEAGKVSSTPYQPVSKVKPLLGQGGQVGLGEQVHREIPP